MQEFNNERLKALLEQWKKEFPTKPNYESISKGQTKIELHGIETYKNLFKENMISETLYISLQKELLLKNKLN